MKNEEIFNYIKEQFPTITISCFSQNSNIMVLSTNNSRMEISVKNLTKEKIENICSRLIEIERNVL